MALVCHDCGGAVERIETRGSDTVPTYKCEDCGLTQALPDRVEDAIVEVA